MTTKGKIWGKTTLLLQTPQIEIHRISILPNSACSLHCHEHKWNAFYVMAGEMAIEVHKNDYNLIDLTELKKEEFTTVPPNEYHRFLTGESGAEALEIYYLEGINPNDIIRKNVGSKA
jgi:mannose-6-phosphate isomerase-like protein (cupin superfamily)